MKPEDIVVSLETAKKLKEAGWPQADSNFYWDASAPPCTLQFDQGGAWSFDSDAPDSWAAPTAEEMLRRLPHDIQLESRFARINFGLIPGEGYRVSYINDAWLVRPLTATGKRSSMQRPKHGST